MSAVDDPAWKAGYAAYRDSLGFLENPHDSYSDAGRRWIDGYVKSMQDQREPIQVGPRSELDLSTLDGCLMPWRPDLNQPQLIQISGKFFVSFYETEVSLHEAMAGLHVHAYTIKVTCNAADTIASIKEAGVNVCLNARVTERGTIQYTELRWETP